MRTIPTKEDLLTEFKSDIKGYPDSDLIEEIVGMANTKGGTLYLGVEDNGTITGVSFKHKDPIGIVSLISNKTVPPIAVKAELVVEEDKDVLIIEIPISRTIVSTSSGKTLRRRVKADGTPEIVPMYPYENQTRLSELALLDFSASPLSGATIDDFDQNQRARLRNIIQNMPNGEKSLLSLQDDELDKALRFIAEIDGKTYPTVTGMLLIGKENKIEKLLPTAKAAFQVLEGTKVRVNLETSGPLLEVFEKFETYMDAWNFEKEMDYGLSRIAIPEFNKATFREGLINAFCHRDYTMLGTVRVLIDDEGLTISSPGGFIDGVTIDNLLTVEPRGKNPALADALKRIGLAEKTGRGIDRIYEGSIIYGRPWPDFSETTSSNVKLFIQRSKADYSFTKMIIDEQNRLGKSLSIYALMILSLLKDNGELDITKLIDMTNISKSKIQSSINNLIEDGLLEVSGKRSFKYRLSKRISKYFDNDNHNIKKTVYDKNDYSEMIMELARKQDGFITKQDVSKLLSISINQAYDEIIKLVSKNKLYKYCNGKYTKYKIVE